MAASLRACGCSRSFDLPAGIDKPGRGGGVPVVLNSPVVGVEVVEERGGRVGVVVALGAALVLVVDERGAGAACEAAVREAAGHG